MNPLDVAVNRMAELRAELAELETFVRVYYRLFPQEKLVAKLASGSFTLTGFDAQMTVGRAVDKSVDKPVDNSQGARSNDSEGEGRGRRKATDMLAEEVESIIREVGTPLNRTKLAAQLEERGFALPSEDKARYIGTVLWRNRHRFRNLPGHGYWLKSEPYGPANYDPASDTELLAALESEAGFAEKPFSQLSDGVGGETADRGDARSTHEPC